MPSSPEDANVPSSRGTSLFKTCFHGVNGISGIGIVSIPYALASGGWLSLILLFIIAIAAYYTGILIKRCMDEDPSIESLPDIGQRAFGEKGRLMVNIAMNCELYLVVTGYLILEGDNLNKLITHVHVDIGGIRINGMQCFVILTALIILPTVWLQDLSLLSYVSATGALASTIFLCALLCNGAFDGTGFHRKGILINWKGLPAAVSLYAFCYSAHPVFPNLYTSMKNKHQFSNVLLVCFTLCTLIYAAIAILGYLMFGSEVLSEVTLNLPKGKISSKVAIYTTLVNPITKYALMLTPIVDAIKNTIPSSLSKKKASHLVLSTTLLLSTVIVALAVPFFGYLMSLVGALLSVSASFLVPCVCYLKISGKFKVVGWDMMVNYGIVVMGISIAAVGTYTSLGEIIKHLKV
ncbi:amino acid transporter AVT1I-like [Neltuma alba]|uniref:amino acid transporter AVT1I-like n=1 Tax=Neltuma alba TaxID=207710 RepID=UPI0010A3C84D|nr:amino acid transporter AVT1I-like [Prosopis alba]XP_028804881.1 amino acid transporter AVT1I-like [Prosopis alba]